jgi:hypothetical protein
VLEFEGLSLALTLGFREALAVGDLVGAYRCGLLFGLLLFDGLRLPSSGHTLMLQGNGVCLHEICGLSGGVSEMLCRIKAI